MNDATEIATGSEPDSADSVPLNSRPEVVGIEGFDYTNGVISSSFFGGELFDYDNNISNDLYVGHTGATSLWYVSWGSSEIINGKLQTRDSGMYRPLNGEFSGGEALSLFGSAYSYPEVDSEVLYAKFEMTLDSDATWGGLSFYAGWEEQLYFGMGGDSEFAISEAGVDASLSGIAITNDQTYTVVIKLDGYNELARLWINPDIGDDEPYARSGAIGGQHKPLLRCDPFGFGRNDAV